MKLVCWIFNNHQWSEWSVFHWNFNERVGGEERTCKWCHKTEKRPISLNRQDKEVSAKISESVQS